MTEEIHDILVPKHIPEPNSVKNPAVQDDTSRINIKESDNGNIDLKAGLENIFTDIVRLRK